MFVTVCIYIVTTALVLVTLLLILLVLMQRPKQEGLGAAFGAGVTDQIWGSQTTNVLQKGTVYMGVLLFVLSLTLAMLKAAKARENTGINLKSDKPPVVEKAADAPAANIPASTTSPAITIPPAGSTTSPITITPAPAGETTPAKPAETTPPAAETPAKPEETTPPAAETPAKPAETTPAPSETPAKPAETTPAATETPATPAETPAPADPATPDPK